MQARDRDRATIRDLQSELEHLRQLAPYATDDYEYLFVVTYGRSGSTLLQGLLNTVDGYQIRGENNGACLRLFQFWSGLEEAGRNQVKQSDKHQPWYGITGFDPQSARAWCRQLMLASVLRPDPGVRVTGFKEIRWFPKQYGDYLRWVADTFPGARFVFNTRDHDGVMSSKWWAKKDPDRARQQLRDYDAKLAHLADIVGSRGYRIHYDDYVADPDRLEDLYRWLGAPWRPDRVAEVLATKHSY